jgi:hypothetical protein
VPQDYETWLTRFRESIQFSYERTRIDSHVCNEPREVQTPARVFPRGSGSPLGNQSLSPEGELPEPYNVVTQTVTPQQIGVRIRVDEWASSPDSVFMDMNGVGRGLALRQGQVILAALSGRVGHRFERPLQTASSGDILEAQRYLEALGFNADTCVVNSTVSLELIKKQQVLEPWQLRLNPQPNLVGMVGQLNLFRIPMSENQTYVFDKSYLHTAKTPIRISFDNMTAPTILTVNCIASAAVEDERAITAIDWR